MLIKISRRQIGFLAVIIGIGVIILGVGLGLILTRKSVGAIVSNGHECAGIGRDILDVGGSAVDAAVAVMFCEGVAMPQSTGLGGGFFMVIYIKENGTVDALNARESAPLNANEDMYNAFPEKAHTGMLSVAVPGELKGLEDAHKKYGKLPWASLVQPTIDLCTNGIYVTPFLENLLASRKSLFENENSFKEIFVDPETNEPFKKGQLVKRLTLAKTLEIIRDKGADALYKGVLTKNFVEDIRSEGGIITEEDMNKYRTEWLTPISVNITKDEKLLTFPLPGSGLVLSLIINLLTNRLDVSKVNSSRNWQRIVESFKYSYAKRSLLGDPSLVPGIDKIIAQFSDIKYIEEMRSKIEDLKTYQDPVHYGANFSNVEDHGTAHVSILAPNGDAVSVTGTINLIFGSKKISKSTGIILNDEMDDFSTKTNNSFGLPPSPANFIKPGKRPLSSMCPSIIINTGGDVRMVLGAAGGSKITTSTALIAIRTLWFKETLTNAINAPRLHHQLIPMEVAYESKFNKKIIETLQTIGHICTEADPANGFAALTGIYKGDDGVIEGSFDPRRTGSVVLL